MVWQSIHRRLRENLYGEVRKNWGRIAEIEERLSCSAGSLNKLCSGSSEFRLDVFLRSIEELGLDPSSFFARALEIHTEPEDFLLQLEESSRIERTLAKVERATRDLEMDETPAEVDSARRVRKTTSELIALLTNCSVREQIRRLRQAKRYRSHDFARAYLEFLDDLRYERATEAAKLAAAVAIHLIPALPGPHRDRLALQCFALGVLGSSRRQESRYPSAARVLRQALELSRRSRLREETARLLQRASYLLRDFGHADRALILLREALEVYVDLDCTVGLGKTLADRGMMFCIKGEYDTAITVLGRALRTLETCEEALPRIHLAALNYLAYACEQIGDLDAADRHLKLGMRAFPPEYAVDKAKLQWLHGTVAIKRGDYARAEDLLRTAAEVIAAKDEPAQEALISLDIVEVLLAQGRTRQASELASGMAGFLKGFENNRLAEAAIVKLVRCAFAGELNQRIVRVARCELDGRRAESGSATGH